MLSRGFSVSYCKVLQGLLLHQCLPHGHKCDLPVQRQTCQQHFLYSRSSNKGPDQTDASDKDPGIDSADMNSTLSTQNGGLETNNSVTAEVTYSDPPALSDSHAIHGKGPLPEPPVECCMTGCVNCVWITYAEELKKYYGDGGEQAKQAIEKIENPSLKAFLKFELGL